MHGPQSLDHLRKLYDQGLSLEAIADDPEVRADFLSDLTDAAARKDALTKLLQWLVKEGRFPLRSPLATGRIRTAKAAAPAPPLRRPGRFEIMAIVGDIHAPHQDEAALSVACQVIRFVQPDFLLVNGDALDFYQLSRFDPDPNRALSLQAELNVAKRCFRQLRDAAPEAIFEVRKGNHEDRLDRWRKRNPEVGYLDCLTLESLLGLGDLNARLYECSQPLHWNGYRITHGDLCRKRGGATAQAMLDRFGTSGVSNHVHRLAQVEKSDAARRLLWIENGCLCKLDPEYAEVADWQHGFTLLTVIEGVVWPELVRIQNGVAYYRGHRFTA